MLALYIGSISSLSMLFKKTLFIKPPAWCWCFTTSSERKWGDRKQSSLHWGLMLKGKGEREEEIVIIGIATSHWLKKGLEVRFFKPVQF
jgi:hypothetical protein